MAVVNVGVGNIPMGEIEPSPRQGPVVLVVVGFVRLFDVRNLRRAPRLIPAIRKITAECSCSNSIALSRNWEAPNAIGVGCRGSRGVSLSGSVSVGNILGGFHRVTTARQSKSVARVERRTHLRDEVTEQSEDRYLGDLFTSKKNLRQS